MKTNTMNILMDQIWKEIKRTRDSGQKEYAHDEDNVFANFERTGKDLNISAMSVLWIFLKKHMDGITAYIKGHKSQREDVRGRIKDAIVYLMLLWAMVEQYEIMDTGERLTKDEYDSVEEQYPEMQCTGDEAI